MTDDQQNEAADTDPGSRFVQGFARGIRLGPDLTYDPEANAYSPAPHRATYRPAPVHIIDEEQDPGDFRRLTFREQRESIRFFRAVLWGAAISVPVWVLFLAAAAFFLAHR